MNLKRTGFFSLLCLGVLSAMMFSFHSGAVRIPWPEIIRWILGKTTSVENGFLLSNLRGPRTCAAFLVGGALGACGLILQTLLKNPLAEPYTLGLSGGGSMGALLGLYLNFEPVTLWVPFLSTAGCLLAMVLVLSLARRGLQFESRSLVLFGVMISLFFGAITVFATSVISPDKVQAALYWLLGEFGTSRDLWIKYLGWILIFGFFLLLAKSRALDALALGEARALSLGFSPKKERLHLVVICSVLTALCVSIAGLVGFIGLVSPHLGRQILKTSRHQWLLITSFLVGALLLTLADTLGRTVAGNTEIPAGSIAALIGAPVLISLLLGYKNAPVE